MDTENLQSQINELKLQLEQLQAESNRVKIRLKEDETVIASLQAWIQYSFGILLKHLNNPEAFDRSQASYQIERVFESMYDKLKRGYRGEGELDQSTDGFDRLYIASQDTANIWRSMREIEFGRKDDLAGYKLSNVAETMLQRLDPAMQEWFPFESAKERKLRQDSRDLLDQIRDRRS